MTFNDTSPSALNSRLKYGLIARAKLLALFCLFGLLTPWLSRRLPLDEGVLPWLLDLASHWQWFYIGGLVLFGAIAAWGDRRWALLVLAMPLPWVAAAPQAPSAIGEGRAITLLSANLHLDNTDVRPLLVRMDRDRPDVVVLVELSPDYARQVDQLEQYPYRKLAPEYSPFGIGVLSKYPLNDVRLIHDDHGVSRIEAKLDVGAQAMRIVAFHPMPPIEARFHMTRNNTLRELAESARRDNVPTIIMGDFNATPWSSAFEGLDELGFRRAGGLEGTWPAKLGRVGLPIDQIMVSPQWFVQSFGVMEMSGSDHRAILARLQLRPN